MKNAPASYQPTKSAPYYNTVPELLDGAILRYIIMQNGRASLFGIVTTCTSEGFEHHAVIEAVDCLAAAHRVRLTLECDPNLGLFKRIRPIVELAGADHAHR